MSIEFFDEFKEVEKEVLSNLAKTEKANIVKDFSIIYPYESFPEGLVIMITDTSLNVLGFAKFKEDRSYFDLKYIIEDVYELGGFTVDPLFFNVSEEVGLMVDEDKVVGFRNEELEDFIIETVDKYDRALDKLSKTEDKTARLTEDTYGEGFNFIDEKGNMQFSKYDDDWHTGEDRMEIDDREKIVFEEDVEDKENDVVNHPSHYTQGDIEVIDYIEQITASYPPENAFLVANVIKYISRAPHKNQSEDINKALWYMNRLVDKYKEE